MRNVIEERRDKFKEWRSNKNIKNFIEYNKAKAIARKIIKQKKQQDFKKFTMSLNKNISTTYVWNKMRVLRNRFNTVAWNKWQGKSREKETDIAINKLALPWVIENRDNKAKSITESVKDKGAEKMEKEITKEEMNRAIGKGN